MLGHFVFLAVMACCLAAQDQPAELRRAASQQILLTQKFIYDLLWHVRQPLDVLPELAKEGRAWDIKANIDAYKNKTVVEEFLQRYDHGMLPRDAVFSASYPEHLEEAVALFKLFTATSNFTVFNKTAMWARVHMNEGQFAYAFHVAIVNAPDFEFMRLPSSFELYPFMFFNSEVIAQAQELKMQGAVGKLFDKDVSGRNTVYIPANYSGRYIQHHFHDQEKLNYFIEDIGLNSFYNFFNYDFPSWMDSKHLKMEKGYRGGLYVFVHQQLLSRYYLERLSNGLGKIEDFDWNEPFPVGYYPTMNHHNSLPLPQREHWSKVPSYKYKYVQEVEELESRIAAAIDSGYIFSADGKLVDIYSHEGFEIISNIIQGNADSYNKNFYGSVVDVAKNILGFNPEPASKYQVVPSALQHHMSNIRDPAFFILYKKIMNYFLMYKSHLPVYSHDELVYPGVKVESVEVDKLVTYFDYFDALINHAVMVNNTEDAGSFFIKARQSRLNHEPFSYRINVFSDKKTKAVVSLFLGPKYDEHGRVLDISENYMNFFMLDQFSHDLSAGVNKIDRSSNQTWFTQPDPVSSEIFYDHIRKVLSGEEDHVPEEQMYGFPDRLLLPKGRAEGMPFQLFVYVSHRDDYVKVNSPVFRNHVFNKRPIDFPLDRPMYAFNFTVPNMYFKDVLIYHH